MQTPQIGLLTEHLLEQRGAAPIASRTAYWFVAGLAAEERLTRIRECLDGLAHIVGLIWIMTNDATHGFGVSLPRRPLRATHRPQSSLSARSTAVTFISRISPSQGNGGSSRRQGLES